MINFQTDPVVSVFLCIIILAIVVAIYYYFARWVFSINERIKNQEKQIEILKKIAAKLGVPESEVSEDKKEKVFRYNQK